MRKGDGADGQRAKVMGNFTTEEGEFIHRGAQFIHTIILMVSGVVSV